MLAAPDSCAFFVCSAGIYGVPKAATESARAHVFLPFPRSLQQLGVGAWGLKSVSQHLNWEAAGIPEEALGKQWRSQTPGVLWRGSKGTQQKWPSKTVPPPDAWKGFRVGSTFLEKQKDPNSPR